MNVLRTALACALFMLTASAFGQASKMRELIRQHPEFQYRPEAPPDQMTASVKEQQILSWRLEKAVQDRFAAGRRSEAPSFDFYVGGTKISLRPQSEIWQYPIDADRTLSLRSSRISYRYAPRNLSGSSLRLAIVTPLERLFSKLDL